MSCQNGSAREAEGMCFIVKEKKLMGARQQSETEGHVVL